jgi:hypothetical protein
MPQLVTVRVKNPDGHPFRIWVPVLPVVLVFAPIVVLAVLVGIAACLFYRISVLRALVSSWRFISALPGTQVDLDEGQTAFLVIIR